MRQGPGELTPRQRLALDAAKLYYLGGMSQQAVAEALHLSRPHVSKLLASAREQRFVRTVVADPRESDQTLLTTLRDRYELTDLRLVVPVGRGPMDRRRALGTGAAEMLDSHATSDRDVVGFWWEGAGQVVLEAMVRMRLRPHALVQLDGAGPDGAPDAALSAFAARTDLPLHTLQEPILHRTVAARLEAETAPQTRRILTLQADCDIAVFDAGLPSASALCESPLVSEEERGLVAEQAVGRICGRFLDAEGRVVAPSLSQRVSGPTLSDLRRIKRTVLVACGTELIPVIRAALGNRYANHLVTDVETAEALAAHA